MAPSTEELDDGSILEPVPNPSENDPTLSEEVFTYLRARKLYENNKHSYNPPKDIPANKNAIIAHLNLQITGLQKLAKKYAALRSVIELIPEDDSDPQWQLLKNAVVHGTIEETEIERGPEGIWLADEHN